MYFDNIQHNSGVFFTMCLKQLIIFNIIRVVRHNVSQTTDNIGQN